jgi:putative flippase GtrA
MLATKIAKFGLVGIINTLIDFAIYNLLTGKRFKLSRIKANLISTTTAMIFSFFANKDFVFHQIGGNVWIQAGTFFAVTAFGLYILQNLVIYTLTNKWTLIPHIAIKITHTLGLRHRLNDEFVSKNTAKLAATTVSLTWNFILFEYVVFRP